MSTSEPVTMPHPNHPDDELLAALAAAEPDATASQSLAAHVAGCDRCTSVVADLRSLRTALGELPDVRPTRPLRFLPPAPEAAPAGRGLGWVELLRRVSGPVMGVATVLILVGAIGTAANSGVPKTASTTFDANSYAGAAASAAASAVPLAASPSGERTGDMVAPGTRSAGATPSPAPVFGGAGSALPVTSGRPQASGSSAPKAVGEASTGGPPFEAVLGIGIVLLAAALLARAAVRRREAPESL